MYAQFFCTTSRILARLSSASCPIGVLYICIKRLIYIRIWQLVFILKKEGVFITVSEQMNPSWRFKYRD
jgi:hypothetical protein